MKSMTRKGGRPRTADEDRRRHTVGIRLTDTLKQALEIAAKEEGQSLSGAIESALKRYFELESYYGDYYAARMFGRLLATTFSMTGKWASFSKAYAFNDESYAESDWMRDPYCYERAATEVIHTLARLRPPGEVKGPEKPGVRPPTWQNLLGKLHAYFMKRNVEDSATLPLPMTAVDLRPQDVAAKVGTFTALDDRIRELRAEAAGLAREVEAQRERLTKEITALSQLYDRSEKQVSDIAQAAQMRGGERYALKVEGDGMIEAGIFDGDTAIIERADDAEDGEIIVAVVDEKVDEEVDEAVDEKVREKEVMLRRLRRQGEKIVLEPANSEYKARVLDPDDVEIVGRLLGLMREF